MCSALFQNVKHVVLEDSKRVCMESVECNCIAVGIPILQFVDNFEWDVAENIENIKIMALLED
jgi:hypothetical protein